MVACAYTARAVDTATDPDFQGRGIFTRLTLEALDALPAEGVELVFNTPNARSLPGYLKMGWQEVGRLPAAVRPTRWRFATVVGTARRPAGRGFVASAMGVPVEEGLADRGAVDRLIERSPLPPASPPVGAPDISSGATATPTSGTACCDAAPPPHRRASWCSGCGGGGSAVEGVVSDVVAHRGSRAAHATLVDRLARAREADYLIRLQQPRVTRDRFVRLPQVGPVLVCRALADIPVPDLRGWAPSMGDVELL